MNDTVRAGDTVWLHGSAKQEFGEIIKWEWKIDNGEWNETNGPDTFYITLQEDKTVICSLKVTDDDANVSSDAIKIRHFITVKDIAAGESFSLFLKSDNTLWTCGSNKYGQLGHGTPGTDERIPVKVMDDVQSVAAGRNHSLIIRNDQTLWTCGDNGYGQLGDGTTEMRLTPVQIMLPEDK